jgi:signal transduction histidine kinase
VSVRLRVLAALVIVALPAILVALVLTHRARHDAFVDAIYATTVDRMEDGGRDRCEEDPARFQLGVRGRRREGGPGRRVRVYDADLAPVGPRERALEPALRDGLTGDSTIATLARESGDVAVAMRMPWNEGPCAVLVVEARSVPPGLRRPRLMLDVVIVLGALAVAFVVVFFALGPPLRRLSMLAAAVRSAPDGGLSPPKETLGRDEIGDVAQALAEASERARAFVARLEARDRALTEYVDGTTHDLAIPLTVLQARLSDAEVAQREGRTIDPALLASAMAEAQYLTQLVANMGAMARLERGEGKIEKRPIELGAIVERTIERFRPAARHHGVTLDFATPDAAIEALGDDILVERLIGNLVHNAIRHHRGDKGAGHVAVVLERAAERFMVRVLDDGTGVTDDLVKQLTAQTDVRDPRRARSPGLGLRIVRNIAAAHGFTIAFARSEAGGLEVTLRGPCAPAGVFAGREPT